MKLVYAMLGLLLLTSAAFAQDPGQLPIGNRDNGQSVVRWKRIVGVISAIDTNAEQSKTQINNPVGKIASGTFPWEARSGQARVNLSTGAASFDVEGLVINGTIFSGTPGPVSAVTGCLVCNAGDRDEAAFDTAPVPLSAQGDASFSGQIQGIPGTCANPLFLIRIANPVQAAGLWIATGVERSSNNNGQ